MAKKHQQDEEPNFIEDFDLDEKTTYPKTLAYLNRPDDEEGLTYKEWLLIYEKRISEEGSKAGEPD